MLGLYYRIWVDLIIKARSRPESRNSWALPSMIFMSISMMLNLFLIMTILQKHILGYYFYHIVFNSLPKYWSNVISGIILFVLPCVLLNYFLIFFKQRYKKLLQKYSYSNGKLFVTYFLISMLLPLVLLFGAIILNRLGIIS